MHKIYCLPNLIINVISHCPEKNQTILQGVRFFPSFSKLESDEKANENDSFWQKPTSFSDSTNQNGGISNLSNFEKEGKNLTPCIFLKNNS